MFDLMSFFTLDLQAVGFDCASWEPSGTPFVFFFGFKVPL